MDIFDPVGLMNRIGIFQIPDLRTLKAQEHHLHRQGAGKGK